MESALSQVPRMFAEPEAFRKALASSTHYHVLDVSHNAPVRLPQSMRTATLPGKDGEDLVSCLYMIREIDRTGACSCWKITRQENDSDPTTKRLHAIVWWS